MQTFMDTCRHLVKKINTVSKRKLQRATFNRWQLPLQPTYVFQLSINKYAKPRKTITSPKVQKDSKRNTEVAPLQPTLNF